MKCVFDGVGRAASWTNSQSELERAYARGYNRFETIRQVVWTRAVTKEKNCSMKGKMKPVDLTYSDKTADKNGKE